MDISPNGSRAIVVGNFKNANGALSDQIVMLDLNGSAAVVDPNWNTAQFTSACAPKLFDSYVDDVDFSPDGSYFVVVATGAGTFAKNTDGTRSLVRLGVTVVHTDTGADVSPTWVDYTGDDTFWSVAVTGTAVYVGGHERWVNNPSGPNNAAVGAVAAPGHRRSRPGERPSADVEPRTQPARRRRVLAAGHAAGSLRRQRHRLHRQLQVQARRDRVLPAGRRLHARVDHDERAAGQRVRGRAHELVDRRGQRPGLPQLHPADDRCADHRAQHRRVLVHDPRRLPGRLRPSTSAPPAAASTRPRSTAPRSARPPRSTRMTIRPGTTSRPAPARPTRA